MQERHLLKDVPLARRKNVSISLPFNEDSQAQIITRSLVNTTAKTFPAANLRIHFSSTPFLRFHLKLKLSTRKFKWEVYVMENYQGGSLFLVTQSLLWSFRLCSPRNIMVKVMIFNWNCLIISDYLYKFV